jgi:hypothetical protein
MPSAGCQEGMRSLMALSTVRDAANHALQLGCRCDEHLVHVRWFFREDVWGMLDARFLIFLLQKLDCRGIGRCSRLLGKPWG